MITESLRLERTSEIITPTCDQFPACQLNQSTECHMQSFLEHLQGWWLQCLTPLPVKKFFLVSSLRCCCSRSVCDSSHSHHHGAAPGWTNSPWLMQKGFVGWFRAGAKGWGVMCYLIQEQELRCHYSSIQTEHPNGNWHGVLNKSNLCVGQMNL